MYKLIFITYIYTYYIYYIYNYMDTKIYTINIF